MNGIEALYKAMNNPELECRPKNAILYYTHKERVEENFDYDFAEFTKEWEIRKRESNLGKAVDELTKIFIGGTTTSNIKKILSKYIKD